MRQFFLFSIIFLHVVIQSFSLDAEPSSYLPYIDSVTLSMSIEEAENVLLETDDSIEKGLAYFRIAVLNTEEAPVRSALEYWEKLYAQESNPVVLAYYATLETMLAATIKGAIKKTKLVKAGMDKFVQATEEIDSSSDNLAKGYVYFLRGRTQSNLPTFFKEFKKETIGNLKIANKYFKKSKASNIYSERLLDILDANVNLSFGKWYAKSKKYRTAVSYYKSALNNIKDYSASNKKIIEEQLAELEKKKK